MLNDPYIVLGIPRGASPEQVNAAYRELMRQCPPTDERRANELNEAYDAIMMNFGSQGGYNAGNYTYAGNTNADYSDIRAKINAGRLDDAQVLLDGIPEWNRDAQWYYLKGTVQQKIGWLEEAEKNFAAACEKDPYNDTYKAAYNKVRNASTGGYRTARRSSGNSGCSGCDICQGLLCADCCCECMGGDLIPCC